MSRLLRARVSSFFPCLLLLTSSIAMVTATSDTPLFTGDSIRSVSGSPSTTTINDASLHQIRTLALRDEQPDAMYVLAMLQFYGQRVDRDVAGAVRLLTRLAQHHGHRDAQFTLGVLLTSGGDSVPRGDQRGAAWLAASAARGHADAKWVLATLVNTGRGVERDPPRALKLLREATARPDAAHPRALFHLGVMLEYGHGGVARDATRAAQLYEAASDRHVLDATYYLALLHAAGRGVPKNTVRASQLLTRAADAGHAAALLRLGEMHADGEGGVAMDYVAALQFFQRAQHAAAVTRDAYVETLAQQRARDLQFVLAQAEARVREQEHLLGVELLRVQVATIDVGGNRLPV
jgi:uncharacterized protein